MSYFRAPAPAPAQEPPLVPDPSAFVPTLSAGRSGAPKQQDIRNRPIADLLAERDVMIANTLQVRGAEYDLRDDPKDHLDIVDKHIGMKPAIPPANLVPVKFDAPDESISGLHKRFATATYDEEFAVIKQKANTFEELQPLANAPA